MSVTVSADADWNEPKSDAQKRMAIEIVFFIEISVRGKTLNPEAIDYIDNSVCRNGQDNPDKGIYDGMSGMLGFFVVPYGYKKLHASPRKSQNSQKTDILDRFLDNEHDRTGRIAGFFKRESEFCRLRKFSGTPAVEVDSAKRNRMRLRKEKQECSNRQDADLRKRCKTEAGHDSEIRSPERRTGMREHFLYWIIHETSLMME